MLNDAESDLRAWQPNLEPIRTNASKLGGNGMASQELPIQQAQQNVGVASADSTSVDAHQQRVEQMERAQEEGTSQVTPPYPTEKQTENAALAS